MTTAPRRLVVHALPGAHARALAEGLAGLADDRRAQQDPMPADAAARSLAADTDATLCIIYEDPVRALCTAMSARADIAAFLEDWTASAGQALDLHRRNRRRSVIFEAGHLQRYAAAALSRLGLGGDSRTLGDIADTAPPPAPLAYVLAQAALAETGDAQAAHEELAASAQILSNDDELTSSDMALQAYAAWQDSLDKAADMPGLRTQCAELESRLAAAEDISDKATEANRDLSRRLEETSARATLLEAQQAEMVSDIEALEAALKTARDDAGAAEASRQALSRTLEETTARAEALETRQAALLSDMKALEQALETARSAADAAQESRHALSQTLAEKSAEADLLRAQQAEMVTDMEELEHRLEATDGARAQAIAERDQKTAALDAAVQTSEHTAAELSARTEDLDHARREIDRIMGSRSMRLTRPLRRLSEMFRRR